MNPAEEVLRAARARAAALARGDAHGLEGLLHERFVWTTHVGQRFDRSEYVSRNTQGPVRWQAQELDDLRVEVVADTAVLVAEVVDIVATANGDPEVYRMPVTQTWVRVEGQWRCLAGHAGPRRAAALDM